MVKMVKKATGNNGNR